MALLEFYGMFDYMDGDTDVYEYTAAEWSKFISAITNNGVTTGSFAATANGLQITVGGGTAFIQGRYGYSDNTMYLTLQPEAPSLQRIDRIVVELNVRNRTMEVKVVQGEAAAESSVAPPALERSENVYQIPLWQALIRAFLKNTEKSSAARESHGRVVVLDGRQPVCVLRLALRSPSSLPFFSLFSRTALEAAAP